MEGIDNCLSFIRVPKRPGKPRSSGLSIVNDRSLSTRQAADLMETSAELIDYMKFTDHAANLARHSSEWFRAKMEVYHRHQVKTFPGGVVFEVAVLQRQVEPLFQRLKEVGFDGVEISEDVIPPLSLDARVSCIKLAQQIGLEVFTEVGRKDPTAPLETEEAIESILRDLEAGAKKVTIENSDLVLLLKTSPDVVLGIVQGAGWENVAFEIGPNGWPDVAAWVIRSFGQEVNLENFDPDRLPFVDGMRRGFERQVNNEFLSVRGGRVE